MTMSKEVKKLTMTDEQRNELSKFLYDIATAIEMNPKDFERGIIYQKIINFKKMIDKDENYEVEIVHEVSSNY